MLLNIMRVCKASKLGTKQRGMECEQERKREDKDCNEGRRETKERNESALPTRSKRRPSGNT